MYGDSKAIILLVIDDDQDVHFCGRCKLTFNDLSEYIKHKTNKVCRDIINKSSLIDVVEKLPIDGSQSESEKSKTGNTADEASTDTAERAQEGAETTGEGPAAKRVEVQFLDPVVGADGVPSSAGEKHGGHKTVDHEKAGE